MVVRVAVTTAVRVVERVLGIYPRQATFVALFLRLFTSSRGKRGSPRHFEDRRISLYITLRKRLHIVARFPA